MKVKIILNEKGNPAGKLADAELHFDEGPLKGLRLTGFAVWSRRDATGFNVTFPARQYSVNGTTRSFVLLRPMDTDEPVEQLREDIITAYRVVAP